jgi:ABC-2 type transport system ATP-binding protein
MELGFQVFVMSDVIVKVDRLFRTFGDVRAVQGLSFEIPRGQVVGFIGANGAGKTTTMRMMVTLDQPDAGEIFVDGFDVVQHPADVRKRIGWMPDSYGAYDYMTVFEYLDFYARAFGYKGAARKNRVQEVMEFTDLTPLAERAMNKLSKGMGQRLCLGRTLLHDPSVLVLDEPAAGLDPKARVEFKHLVRLLAGHGKTLFISSHILSELEEMCDSLLFIDQGKLVHHGTAEHLKRNNESTAVIVVESAADPGSVARWIDMNPGVELIETTKRGARIKLLEGGDEQVAWVLRKLVSDGIAVTEFRREQLRLEDAFVNMLKNGIATKAPPEPPPLPTD